MKRIGITGGMGSGKTTVLAEFAKLGVPCFLADRVAAAYYNDPEFLRQLPSLFDDTVIRPDGTADKQRIADIVFSNSDKLRQLNSLVHPRVMHDFDDFCRQNADKPYVLFESAILYEHRLDRQMDAVIGVYLDLPERLRRLQNRDGVGEDQLLARIANQWPAEEILRRADYVILNYEGNPRLRQVAYIDKEIKK